MEGARRPGVLLASGFLASGFLVGESFVGVLLACADLMTCHSSSLAVVGPAWDGAATWLGLAVFLVGLVVFYRRVSIRSS